jgi:hypothetical protein
MNYNDKYMLELIRAAVFNACPTEYIEDIDWNYIYNKSVEQNIAGLVYCSISKLSKNLQPSESILKQWKQNMISTVVTMNISYSEFLRMNKYIRDKGLVFVGLKGCALRNLYPVPELRTMGDFDVFVRKNELSDIVRCFKEKNYTVEKDLFGVVAKKDNVYWEIFFSLEEEFQINTDKNNSLIFDNCIELDGMYVPNSTYFLAHVIIHTGRHYIEKGAGIRNLCDIALFISKYFEEIDFEILKAICKEQNYENIYCYVLNVTEQCFGLDLSRVDFERKNCDLFLEYTLLNGVFGKNDNVLIRQVSLDENENTKGLRRLFFPAAKTLENRYKYLKKCPYLLPIAWIQRILYGRFGKKVKFTRMLSDINDAMEFSEERLKWLKKLGLNDKH